MQDFAKKTSLGSLTEESSDQDRQERPRMRAKSADTEYDSIKPQGTQDLDESEMTRSLQEGMPGVHTQQSQVFSVRHDRERIRKSITLHVPRMSNERRQSNLQHSGNEKPEDSPNSPKISKREEFTQKGQPVAISCSSWGDGDPNLPKEILEEKDEGSSSLDKNSFPLSVSQKSEVEMSGVPRKRDVVM